MPEIQPSSDAQATAIAVAYEIALKAGAVAPGLESARDFGAVVGEVAQEILALTSARAVAERNEAGS